MNIFLTANLLFSTFYIFNQTTKKAVFYLNFTSIFTYPGFMKPSGTLYMTFVYFPFLLPPYQ